MKHIRNGFSVRMALAALVGLGAKASLIGDPLITLTIPLPASLGGDIIENFTVIAGPELSAGDGSLFSNFLLNPPPIIVDPLKTILANSSYFIDVDATSITFFWDFSHQFSFFFSDLDWQPPDGPGTITGATSVIDFGALSSPLTVNTTADTVDVSFDCVACGPPLGGVASTQVTVNILTVHAPVSAVPLPAALPLFLSALAGLGLMGWRRRQAGAGKPT